MFAPHAPSSYQGEESALRRRADEEDLRASELEGTSSITAISSARSLSPDGSSSRDEASVSMIGGSRGRAGSRSSLFSANGSRLGVYREGSGVVRGEREEGEEDQDGMEDEEEFEEDDTTMTRPIYDEATPLLFSSTPGNGRDGKGVVDPYSREAYKGEMNTLLKYTLPICGTHFLEYSLLVVTIISVGHIGTVELAASSLASMTSNVVALSVIQGFCSALDTLCTQSYTSSRPKDTSLHALRTFVVLMMLLIPQVVVFWNGESILLLLKQDPRVAERAGAYLKVLSFGLPGYAGFECMRRFLQSQGLMTAPTIVLLVTAPMNALLNYLLVWGPDSIRLGFVGAPLATAISMNTMFIVSLLWSYFYAPRDAWGGLSWQILSPRGIVPNIVLGIVGSFQIQTEWLGWEVVALASSYLGPTALAAQSILLTSASLFYQIPYALSVASAVRTGNLLGLQKPKLARTTSRVSMALSIILAIVNSGLLILFRVTWGRLFSSDADVIALVAAIIPLVALFQLTDALSGATAGLLRGAGKAPLGALINLTAYYICGLPVGFVLAFSHRFALGLFGLWIGLTVALTVTAVLTSYVIIFMDWEDCAERVRKRTGGPPKTEDAEDHLA